MRSNLLVSGRNKKALGPSSETPPARSANPVTEKRSGRCLPGFPEMTVVLQQQVDVGVPVASAAEGAADQYADHPRPEPGHAGRRRDDGPDGVPTAQLLDEHAGHPGGEPDD